MVIKAQIEWSVFVCVFKWQGCEHVSMLTRSQRHTRSSNSSSMGLVSFMPAFLVFPTLPDISHQGKTEFRFLLEPSSLPTWLPCLLTKQTLVLDGRIASPSPLGTPARCNFLLSVWEVGIVSHQLLAHFTRCFHYSFLDPSCSYSLGLSSVCQCPCLEQPFAKRLGNSKEAIPHRQK